MSKLKFGMTAAEARALDIEVPEYVPDAAVVMPLGVDESTITTKDGEQGQVIVEMQIRGYWNWIDCTFEIGAEQ